MRRVVPAAAVVALLLASPSASAEPPQAEALAAEVRRTYAGLDAYRDFGEASSDEVESQYFETAMDAEGRLVWRLMDAGREERVFWSEGAGAVGFVYDRKRRQYKPVESLAAELASTFGDGTAAALMVPRLLLGAPDALSPTEDATVEEGDCDDVVCWVLAWVGGNVSTRLWLDRETLLIRDVELRQAAGVMMRIRHTVAAVEAALATDLATYKPPMLARRVEDWEDPQPQADATPTLDIGFIEEITVAQRQIVARIVDSRGAPLPDLVPRDLVARVGKREVPVVAIDWHSSRRPAAETATISPAILPAVLPATADALPRRGEPLLPIEGEPVGEPAGKLVVLFVQIGHHMVVTLDETTIGGHLKILPHVRGLVRGLHPDDLVAVVSFDSRLKLWHDFTRDREVIAETLWDSIGFGRPPSRPTAAAPSLAAHFDFDAARRAANTEEALKVLADALTPLPGVKELIYLGWGLGRYTQGFGMIMPTSYNEAVTKLASAQATVHVLDVTQASGHALASGLKSVAVATGGTYASTYDFASRKVDELARVISGYYVVTIDRSDRPEVRGRLRIELREKDGTVLFRPISL